MNGAKAGTDGHGKPKRPRAKGDGENGAGGMQSVVAPDPDWKGPGEMSRSAGAFVRPDPAMDGLACPVRDRQRGARGRRSQTKWWQGSKGPLPCDHTEGKSFPYRHSGGSRTAAETASDTAHGLVAC